MWVSRACVLGDQSNGRNRSPDWITVLAKATGQREQRRSRVSRLGGVGQDRVRGSSFEQTALVLIAAVLATR